MRITCRQKHFSHRTDKSYVYWIRQFILFNKKRYPSEMGSISPLSDGIGTDLNRC
ncbi:MAG: phage integrase N-terminal SAM-like domain-containing protein [Candidatus Thiodiazotropha lotti]|uniref:Phage integrase N-terminal SAM-like domain-containing protein n=1 Tax=Candidatus Thiodiazotropha lotti TaxID=2792787 RepID=A0A9E4MXK6_9GAMM|nr:phage integrase N-terminal SAM-like domain-containing protein [Candidatus Thiodiazotropha lotti]MCW4201968.1 phage integrase N-terminal SAM-like domain-containing protein [Candidatus Thiodiazotropha lotti]